MSKVKKQGKAQLFTNPVLEVFTKTNPYIHVTYYGAWIVFFLYQSEVSLVTAILLFVSGAFAWTLLEYIIHRFLFHVNSSRFQYMIHGVHHEYPKDEERLLMPPLPGTIVLVVLFSIFYLLLREFAFTFFAGVMTGYLLYTAIHYTIHAYKPNKYFKHLWAHHLKHHNPAFENKAFGVSTSFWDRVFGTMP